MWFLYGFLFTFLLLWEYKQNGQTNSACHQWLILFLFFLPFRCRHITASMNELLVSNIMYTCQELVTQLTLLNISNKDIQSSNPPFLNHQNIYAGMSFSHELSGKVYYDVSINLSEFIIYYIKGWLCWTSWTSQSPD